jgi:exosortase E/protease (VPEID-CTERM system)
LASAWTFFLAAIPAVTSDITAPSAGSILSRRSVPIGLFRRIGCLALLFACELIALSYWLDTPRNSSGLTAFFATWATPIVRSIIAAAAVFAAFAYLRAWDALKELAAAFDNPPIHPGFAVLHAAGIFGFGALWFLVATGTQSNWIGLSWFLSGILAGFAGAFAFVPPRVWLELLRRTGTVSVYALAAGALSFPLRGIVEHIWIPCANLTFSAVRLCLRPFVKDLIANAATRDLGTPRFTINVHATCSGVEGAGLILVFGALALFLFRDECRFPRALIVLPAGVCILWMLNAVRLSALILIGDAGAPRVAMGGFHSQAGWIAFTAVAIGLTLAFRRISWLRVGGGESALAGARTEYPAAPYLVPFLAVLVAAMIARAASGGFEWLYALRFFAAAAALWAYRSRYALLDWRAGWLAAGIGAAVFGMWLALDAATGPHNDNGLQAALAALPLSGRIAWIGFRILAAVVSVPVAEELAFRGFLMRRVISADFESVNLRTFRVAAVLVSSVAFGLLHGDRWLAGTLAGVLYAVAAIGRGRIGDAVVAHATTNGLLALWVLAGGNWHLW